MSETRASSPVLPHEWQRLLDYIHKEVAASLASGRIPSCVISSHVREWQDEGWIARSLTGGATITLEIPERSPEELDGEEVERLRKRGATPDDLRRLVCSLGFSRPSEPLIVAVPRVAEDVCPDQVPLWHPRGGVQSLQPSPAGPTPWSRAHTRELKRKRGGGGAGA